MKTAEEWAQDIWCGDNDTCGCDGACKKAIERYRAIQFDVLNTIALGIASMMGAPPWMDNPMGDEILKRISRTMQEVAKP